ncbi:MAG: hypothetical protein ACTSXV_01125 [Alphaproteobacteria bacterium]
MKKPYEIDALIAYVGDALKAKKFNTAFEKLEKNKFAFVWSWQGFTFGFWYLFYRRAFLFGAIWFALFFLTPLSLPIKIIFSSLLGGLFIPSLLKKQYHATKKTIESKHKNRTERLALLAERGGVNRWALYIPVVFFFITAFTMRPYFGLMYDLMISKTAQETSHVMMIFIKERAPQTPEERLVYFEKKMTTLLLQKENNDIPSERVDAELKILTFEMFEIIQNSIKVKE